MSLDRYQNLVPGGVEGINLDRTIDNPILPRWTYQPATPHVPAPPRETGLSAGTMPYGVPVYLKTFDITVENCTMDEDAPRMKTVQITAKEASDILRDKLPGKGYREFFIGESVDIAAYWACVHPFLSDVGIECPFNEEDDFEPRETCPSCLRAWLMGGTPNGEDFIETLDDRIERFASQGLVDAEKARALAQIILEANTEYLATSLREWTDLANDYQNPEGRTKGFSQGQHFMRKNVHTHKAQDRELLRTAALGESMAEALKHIVPQQGPQAAGLSQQDIAQIAAVAAQTFFQIQQQQAAPATAAAEQEGPQVAATTTAEGLATSPNTSAAATAAPTAATPNPSNNNNKNKEKR